MYKKSHHNRVAAILHSLNSELLAEKKCFFGGGTAIVLAHQEYRESIDIDFIISDPKGYQILRNLIKTEGIKSITRSGVKLELAKEFRTDQYGLRTMILLDNIEIKFEIIFESRIQLEEPTAEKTICGIQTLTTLDMATTKLLANSDRWSDDSVFNRDLIDLAMLDLTPKTFSKAIKKARTAYGESVERDLGKAIDSLIQRKGRLELCMSALKIESIPKALLWSKIRKLHP